MKQVFKDIEDLHEQVLVKHQVSEIHFDIPEQLTRESYIQVIRKVLACVRHEAYFKFQEMLKSSGKEKLTVDEVDSVLDKIASDSQEVYRAKSLELYKIPVPSDDTPKRVMQKAYLKYSTISSIPSILSKSGPIRSRW